MRPVKRQTRNAIVALDSRRFLQPGRQILADFAEDGDLPLDDFLLAAVLHVTSNVADEALLGPVVEDALP